MRLVSILLGTLFTLCLLVGCGTFVAQAPTADYQAAVDGTNTDSLAVLPPHVTATTATTTATTRITATTAADSIITHTPTTTSATPVTVDPTPISPSSHNSQQSLPHDIPYEVLSNPIHMLFQNTTAPQKQATLAALDQAAHQPYDRVALATAFGNQPFIRPVVRSRPLPVAVGNTTEFWVNNLAQNKNNKVVAELRYVGPVVLMYVEKGFSIDQTELEQVAATFEQTIYPTTRALFGSEWTPGVDGDTRLTILTVQSKGDTAIGYFSSRDLVPVSVNRFSNERDMLYMKVTPRHPAYLPTLAHEFQHMIHWHQQRNAATWFQEGCAKLSEDLNGYGNDSFVGIYLLDTDTPLTTWALDSAQSHYGAANLFLRYLYAQYVGRTTLATLVQSDPSNHLQAFADIAATVRPDITSFQQLFGDWAIANLLNNVAVGDGRYTYDLEAGRRRSEGGLMLLAKTVKPTHVTTGTLSTSVAQFGVDYLALPSGTALDVTFTGSVTVPLVGALPDGTTAWWSGRRDNSVATLTHAVDLRGHKQPVLHVRMWYELEKNYDYAYIALSDDGGTQWRTLPGTHTTTDDPQGANYGHGFTGVSGLPLATTDGNNRGIWVDETVDLSDYAGKEVQLRFWQINDEAYNSAGMLVDSIRLCDGNNPLDCFFVDDCEQGAGAWQAQGFVQTEGILPQYWEIRLVRTDSQGNTTVEPLRVVGNGITKTHVAPNETAVLMVAAATPYTTHRAAYRVELHKVP